MEWLVLHLHYTRASDVRRAFFCAEQRRSIERPIPHLLHSGFEAFISLLL